MLAYIARRAVSSLPVIVLVSALTFFGQQLIPGDPLLAILGEANAGDIMSNPEALQAARERYGLDKPMVVQYGNYVGALLKGDLGRSIRSRRPVLDMLVERLPTTIKLNATTYFTNIAIGIALGITAALRPGIPDFLATSWAVLGVATPNFWAGILLILVFSVWLGWLPTSGWVDPFTDPINGARHLVLPVLASGFFGSASIMRQTRSAMLDVMRQDYVTTARAKGLSERRVIRYHALKNAMLPTWTVIGLSLASLIGGSVLIERVFAIPGVGRLAIDASTSGDFPVIQGIVILSTVAIVVANLITDIVYGYLDPRIRY